MVPELLELVGAVEVFRGNAGVFVKDCLVWQEFYGSGGDREGEGEDVVLMTDEEESVMRSHVERDVGNRRLYLDIIRDCCCLVSVLLAVHSHLFDIIATSIFTGYYTPRTGTSPIRSYEG